MADDVATMPQASNSLSATWTSLTSLTSNPNLLATKEKGKGLLNWVVASASGTPTNTPIPPVLTPSTPVVDKMELCCMTFRALNKLEACRLAARKSWLDFVVVSQRYAIKTQILLTKLQGMQESFILILQDHLRKIIVVESSFLANQQYDIQMLFKVMEDIDVREDMRQFILKNAGTPLDLYESDDDNDEGAESDIDRDRSTSLDVDEHDVEIVIDKVGKPITTSKSSQSVRESMNDIWCNSPWTSDIFPKTVKLSHIKELPLPPSEDTVTFSLLKSVIIETHLDKLDSKSSHDSCQHQYLEAEKVRQLSRLSLVSRHIEKHNSLVGEGQAGSLVRLEIAPSTVQKKRSSEFKSNEPPATNPAISSPLGNDDPLSHPLNNNHADVRNTPPPTPMVKYDKGMGSGSRDIFDGEESDDEDEDLMSYGTAEEAIEKMVILQKRMREYWADLIEQFSDHSGGDSGKVAGDTVTQSSESDELTGDEGVSEEKRGQLSDDRNDIQESRGIAISSNGESSEALDQLDGSDMLSRSLKDADNETSENVDSVKCREIMNSFGLLDAVSVDVEENWHQNNNEGTSDRLPKESSSLESSNISPQAVQDMHISTPVMRNKFSMPSESGALSIPFLDTSKSDFSENSETFPKSSPCVTPYTDQLLGTSTDDMAQFSMNHFGNATPESLDFLSS